MTTNWLTCVCDDDYEICDTEPYQIRRKSNKRIIKESKQSCGYFQCEMNGKKYYKHRVIALQFIHNDDPDNKVEVDHINRDENDNRIDNLRWCTSSENKINRSSWVKRVDKYFDDIPGELADIIVVKDYGKHKFNNLYFVDDCFYVYNGLKYRRLHINSDKSDLVFVYAFDKEQKRAKIYYTKFKRIYGLI